jgi:hypothetical protein
MSSIEEKLWDYIDGNCTPAEHEAIDVLIAQDENYRTKYLELLALNREIAAMEFDEPSMAFTYNVMETIRADHAKKPLKAKVNGFIIKGIAWFFILTIAALVVILLASIKWHTAGTVAPVIDVKSYLNGPALQVFLFFDVVLALFLFDSVLRKRFVTKNS